MMLLLDGDVAVLLCHMVSSCLFCCVNVGQFCCVVVAAAAWVVDGTTVV
jgi:hypothetical protein